MRTSDLHDHARTEDTRIRNELRDLLIVGCGGFIGSVLRFLTGMLVASLQGPLVAPHGGARFPSATLAVNVIGCFVIGMLGSVGQHVHPWSANARLFLFTGLLGGFTTYSAFGYETFELARIGALTLAGVNVALQLLLGFAAVWAGYRVALAFAPALLR